jgi:NADPH2:quinone reductase
VKVAVSAVNPTDWKARSGSAGGGLPFDEIVPNQDGAGMIDAVGQGVDPARIGQRVWLWEAAWERPNGTAQEAVVLPADQAVELPEAASLDLGASLGIPALTAHRCLTVIEAGPARVGPGSLAGRRVLVAGGAGAVGHFAIQLARFAGASVIATVSSASKAALALAAGADHVVNYREAGAEAAIREYAPSGVDLVVEVAVAANVGLDVGVLAPGGTVAAYAATPGEEVALPVRELMARNARYQFVLVYTVPAAAKRQAVVDVGAALAAGALSVGAAAGLSLVRYPLEQTADAHAAVEAGAVGKVLIDVAV